MRIQEQYEQLIVLRKRTDELLKHLDRKTIKNLIIDFVRDSGLRRMMLKDNQFYMLHCFCTVWVEEQRKLTPLGIEQDIFYGIHSLADVEEKYMSVKFGVLRLERDMPLQYCEETVNYIIENQISGIALSYIIKNETLEREKNIIRLSRLLKEKGEYVTAAVLLREWEEVCPGSRGILMEMADCWMAGRQWDAALDCLEKIKKPGKAVTKLIAELREAAKNEGI